MLMLGGQPALLDPARDQRTGTRRKLRLEALGSTSADKSTKVLVHDLSQTGILIQTEAELAEGEAIQVELPDGEARDANVVWASDGLFGCEFERPISQAVMSAALLKAPVYRPMLQDEDEPRTWTHSDSFERLADQEAGRFSLRTRVAVIVGLGLLSWTPLALGIAAIIS